MGKLLGGLGLCLVLGSVLSASAQDRFHRYEPTQSEAAAAFGEFPQAQEPIIQSIPVAQRVTPYNEKPMRSRAKNAHVRTPRTAAQNYIYQRAVFQAAQRNHRMELRKWKGESMLRPSNPPDHSWFTGYSVPVQFPSY